MRTINSTLLNMTKKTKRVSSTAEFNKFLVQAEQICRFGYEAVLSGFNLYGFSEI